MYRFLLVVFMMAFSIAPALAQETTSYFDFNKDRFMAGSKVVQDTEGVDDLFMVGETVQSKQDITGSAHLAGRKVISTGAIGGDVYVTGMEVSLEGKVTGDVTVTGYNIQMKDVAGDVRASGASLTLSGPVSGYALVNGRDVTFDSVVKGDVSLAAEEVEFGDESRIEGKLTIYEDDIGEIKIPAGVISEDRVERRDISEWTGDGKEAKTDNWGSAVFKFIKRILFITVIASLIAAVRPQKLNDLRQSIFDQPLQNLLFGFLALSTGLGATIIVMFSGLGFLLVLVSVLIVLLGGFIGYVIGVYTIGVRTLQFANRAEPSTLGNKALAAVVGGLVVSLIALIPYLGWLFVLAITLLGFGSLAVRLFRPVFLARA